MNKNDLTIIIPCFNMEKYIAKCLDSIFNQTYKNYNIIVVDDASTDDTYNILKEYETNHDNMLIIENKVKYKYLSEVFDKYHEMPLETLDWHDGMIKEATGAYK